MKRIITIIILIFLAHVTTVRAQISHLVRSTPEAEGLDSRYVRQFFDSLMSAKSTYIHSCIIMRHGHVIAEIYPSPWKKEYGSTMYSTSKTFTAAAVGMCIQDSLLSLNDSIGKYLSQYIDSLTSDTIRNIRIRDLLTMESGLAVDTRMRTHETNWLRAYLNTKPKAAPGELWAYDSIDTYILSAIIQTVTGMTLMDFLQERLFVPLGIHEAAWEESPEGISCGGWGLYMKPESMARFGQLLLRGGIQHGVQLIPSWWVKEMMTTQTERKNYGYQMWQFKDEGWAQANGAYGQYIYVMPTEDMVITITQCNHGNVPFHRWINNLLSRNCCPRPLTPGANLTELRKAQQSYHLRPIRGERQSPKYNHRNISLALADNMLGWTSLVINLSYEGVRLRVTDKQRRTYNIKLGYNEWIESEINGNPYCPRPFMNNFSNLPKTWHVAGSYAWSDPNTLNLRLHWVDWISSADISIRLQGARATLVVKPQDTGKGLRTNAWLK